MAITISKEPSGIYPAYNDAYLVFTSDEPNQTRGEIVITNLSSQVFSVNADPDGNYMFNLKEIVMSLINTNGFKDADNSYPAGFGVTYPYGYVELDVDLQVVHALGTDSDTTHLYEFIRGQKQIGESVYSNLAQLLNYSDDGINYYLSYWEGFPFSFELQRMANLDDIEIANNNTGESNANGAEVTAGSFVASTRYRIKTIGTTDFTLIGAASNTVGLIFTASGVGSGTGDAYTYTPFIASADGSYRVFMDKVSSNFTTDGILPVPDVENLLEIYLNDTFATNLYIKKMPIPRGVYLKWYNADGGYSYFLFERFFKETLQGKTIGVVGSNSFDNVGSIVAPTLSLGKEGRQSYRLKTTVDANEANIIRSLFTSPSVQMWTSQEAYVAGQWVDVEVKSGLSLNNKKSLNDMIVNIELPNLITARL